MVGDKPIVTERSGNVSISGWDNEIKKTDGTTFVKRSFKIQKRFTEDDGKTWKDSSSLTVNDLVRVRELLSKVIALEMVKAV